MAWAVGAATNLLKTCGLLAYSSHSLQHSQKLYVHGQWDLQVRERKVVSLAWPTDWTWSWEEREGTEMKTNDAKEMKKEG